MMVSRGSHRRSLRSVRGGVAGPLVFAALLLNVRCAAGPSCCGPAAVLGHTEQAAQCIKTVMLRTMAFTSAVFAMPSIVVMGV